MEKIGWKVETISAKDTSDGGPGQRPRTPPRWREKENYVFIKNLPFLPLSVIKILRYYPPVDHLKLKQLIEKYHPILVKLEPLELEKKIGSQVYYKLFKPTNFPLTPTKTIWIDLKKSEPQLLKEMKPKTRYNLKKAQKLLFEQSREPKGNTSRQARSIKIIPGDKITKQQINDFHKLWSRNKPFNCFFKPSYHEFKSLIESFGSKCFFVNVNHCHSGLRAGIYANSISIDSRFRGNDKEHLTASCLILTSSKMAFYWHNASTKEAKKLFAPTLCVWKAIKESKKRRLKVFDFEGVWDERYPKLNQGWKGFTKFKLGFAT